jgi:hypothetical protein
MEIKKFNLLTIDQKISLVDSDGVYLVGIHSGKHVLNLYFIYSFYVELCYDFRNDLLEYITVLPKSSHLEPYIEEITLNIE